MLDVWYEYINWGLPLLDVCSVGCLVYLVVLAPSRYTKHPREHLVVVAHSRYTKHPREHLVVVAPRRYTKHPREHLVASGSPQ